MSSLTCVKQALLTSVTVIVDGVQINISCILSEQVTYRLSANIYIHMCMLHLLRFSEIRSDVVLFACRNLLACKFILLAFYDNILVYQKEQQFPNFLAILCWLRPEQGPHTLGCVFTFVYKHRCLV